MARYLAWVAVAALTLWVIFVGGGWWGLYNPVLRMISVALAGASIITWAIVAWRIPAWRPKSALMPAILACLGALTIATLGSRIPRASLEYLGYAVILAALYLVLVRILAQPFFRTRFEIVIIGLTAMVGGAYLVANLLHWMAWWELVGRIAIPPLRPAFESLTFGNPSTVLTLVLLLLCAAVAVIGLADRGRVAVVCALGTLAVFAFLASGSRSGWFAVGVATIVVAATWLADPGRRAATGESLQRRLAGPWSRLLAATAVVGAVGTSIVLAPTVIRRLTEGGEDLRFNFVIAAMRMFGESPVVGTGPGTWVIQRIRYTSAPETDYYIPHAHNVYAQSAAELGLVGLLAGVVSAVLLVRLIRSATRDRDPVRRRWAWAAAFALTYFAAHDLLDFYANMPAILLAAALPIAWLDATAPVPDRPARSRRTRPIIRIGPLAGLLAVALACGGLLWSEQAAVLHDRAVSAYNEGDWAQADGLATAALAGDPAWSPYRMTAGLAAAAMGDHPGAVAAFRQVAESDDLPEAWLDLAAESILVGDRDGARTALAAAARLGLQRPAVALGIGELARQLGETDLADAAYAAAIARSPSLAGDPWWGADPDRALAFERAVTTAIAIARPHARWEIALMRGHVESALALAGEPAARVGVADPIDVIRAWTGDAAAEARVVTAAFDRPLDGVAVGWAARLAGRRGDRDAQNEYLRWLYVIEGGAGTELRVSEQVLLGREVQGDLSAFWGMYTYRRPTPWNPLVPSVVQLAVE